MNVFLDLFFNLPNNLILIINLSDHTISKLLDHVSPSFFMSYKMDKTSNIITNKCSLCTISLETIPHFYLDYSCTVTDALMSH